jgi:hypothetical protein
MVTRRLTAYDSGGLRWLGRMDGGTFTLGGLMHGREGLGLSYIYIV